MHAAGLGSPHLGLHLHGLQHQQHLPGLDLDPHPLDFGVGGGRAGQAVQLVEEGGLRLVATDSYRLAVRDLEGKAVLDEGQSVLVPSRALKELERLLGAAAERPAGVSVAARALCFPA